MMISIIHEGLSWKLWSICVGQKHWLEPQIEFPQLLLWQLSHQGHPEMWPQAGIDLVGIPTLKIVGRWNVLINHLTCPYSPLRKTDDKLYSVSTIETQGRLNWMVYIFIEGRVNSCEYFINTRSIFTDWAGKQTYIRAILVFWEIFYMFCQSKYTLNIFLDIYYFLILKSEWSWCETSIQFGGTAANEQIISSCSKSMPASHLLMWCHWYDNWQRLSRKLLHLRPHHNVQSLSAAASPRFARKLN